MTSDSQVTFRDFAGAVMSNDLAAAGRVLEQLLGLDSSKAAAAATYFLDQTKSAGPSFMSKAMGLRQAVTSGTDAEVGSLLVDCFGLDEGCKAAAVRALSERYPRS